MERGITCVKMKAVPMSNLVQMAAHFYPDHRAKLNYIHTHRTQHNERWDRELRADGKPKSLTNYFNAVKRNVKALTGRKIQAKAMDNVIQDAVVVIDEHTTMEDLKTFAKAMEQEFGFTCIQIHIHRDEGYLYKIDGVEQGKLNLHAHVFFETTNRKTGKSWKRKADAGSKMQDIAAKTLAMQRGTPKAITQTEGLDVIQYKQEQARKRDQEMQEKLRIAQNLLQEREKEEKRLRQEEEILQNSLKTLRNEAKTAENLIRRSKELTGEIKPKIIDIEARNTKTYMGGLIKRKDKNKILQEYMENTEMEKQRIREEQKQLKNEHMRLKASEQRFKALYSDLGLNIRKTLGNRFDTIYNAVQRYLWGYGDSMETSLRLWKGESIQYGGKTFTADAKDGKLLVNGKSRESYAASKSQESQNVKVQKPKTNSKGFSM